MFYKVSTKVATGAGRHAKRLDLDKLLHAFPKGSFSVNRGARKHKLGKVIISNL